ALVRVELRIAHAIRNAVKAADAAVPALADLEAVEAVGAIKVLVAQRYPQTSRRLVRACLEQIVGRGADLPACEHHRRAALQDLDRANGVVESEDTGGLEERQRRHAVQRRSHQLRREVRRIAAA